MDGVAAMSQMVEENAWITYRHNQAIVALRGVDGEYPKVSGLDTLLYEGVYRLTDTVPTARRTRHTMHTTVLITTC